MPNRCSYPGCSKGDLYWSTTSLDLGDDLKAHMVHKNYCSDRHLVLDILNSWADLVEVQCNKTVKQTYKTAIGLLKKVLVALEKEWKAAA